jgi:hypothetical protein
MPLNCKEKAADLAFDVTKQFLSIAFAGIAFVVGMTYSTPGAVSGFLMWMTVSIFGLSALLGLLFLLHGVNLLSIQETYDIYASSLRALAVIQIVLVIGGVALLAIVLSQRPAKLNGAGGNMEIKVSAQQSVQYPIDPNRNTTVEIDGSKVKIITSK